MPTARISAASVPWACRPLPSTIRPKNQRRAPRLSAKSARPTSGPKSNKIGKDDRRADRTRRLTPAGAQSTVGGNNRTMPKEEIDEACHPCPDWIGGPADPRPKYRATADQGRISDDPVGAGGALRRTSFEGRANVRRGDQRQGRRARAQDRARAARYQG